MKIVKKMLLMCLVTIYSISCNTTKLYYHGRVLDIHLMPVKDVSVSEQGTTNQTLTDTNGYFKMPREKKVYNSLHFFKKFYHPQTYPVIWHQHGETTEWNFVKRDTTVVILYPIIH